MSIRTFDFAYGRGRKTFELDDALILKEVRTETFPVMENVAEGVLEAIHHPIGLPSIAEIVKRRHRRLHLQRSDARREQL